MVGYMKHERPPTVGGLSCLRVREFESKPEFALPSVRERLPRLPR
jgi:hypothetical protein